MSSKAQQQIIRFFVRVTEAPHVTDFSIINSPQVIQIHKRATSHVDVSAEVGLAFEANYKENIFVILCIKLYVVRL